jgi:hypothetical protein
VRVAVCLIALTAAALAGGVASPPAALVELRAEVERGQAELSARLICRRRTIEALTTEDERQLDAAAAACERAD